MKEDKYENILTLIGYYDIESRIPIRLLMLQVFGVLCGMDREIISIFLSSILPNELGRDINNRLTGTYVCTYSCNPLSLASISQDCSTYWRMKTFRSNSLIEFTKCP